MQQHKKSDKWSEWRDSWTIDVCQYCYLDHRSCLDFNHDLDILISIPKFCSFGLFKSWQMFRVTWNLEVQTHFKVIIQFCLNEFIFDVQVWLQSTF